MLYNYKTVDQSGASSEGSIEAPSQDAAIASLQRRGLYVVSVEAQGVNKGNFLKRLPFFNRVTTKDVVILSRQIATLFEAKVSVMQTFRMLGAETDHPILREKLLQITDDIKGGVEISQALSRHPDLFSPFFISMVRSGEESGKLSEAFNFLADYLDRNYALTSKARNALIYPAFVIVSFIVVIILMLVFIIPRLSVILEETGQSLPIYTRIIINISDIFVILSPFLAIGAVAGGVFLARYLPTPAGKEFVSRFKLAIPYVGNLYRKLYFSRISDNLNTMVTSGISMVRALEITADVVDNTVYRDILRQTIEAVKGGSAVSDVFSTYDEIPSIMVQMIRVGEETGKLGFVLDTMAKFYQREVNNEVDTLVGMIEPVMIVVLGAGVGVLLTAVLVPIYNIASGL